METPREEEDAMDAEKRGSESPAGEDEGGRDRELRRMSASESKGTTAEAREEKARVWARGCGKKKLTPSLFPLYRPGESEGRGFGAPTTSAHNGIEALESREIMGASPPIFRHARSYCRACAVTPAGRRSASANGRTANLGS